MTGKFDFATDARHHLYRRHADEAMPLAFCLPVTSTQGEGHGRGCFRLAVRSLPGSHEPRRFRVVLAQNSHQLSKVRFLELRLEPRFKRERRILADQLGVDTQIKDLKRLRRTHDNSRTYKEVMRLLHICSTQFSGFLEREEHAI